MRTKPHSGEFALHASYNTEDHLRSPHTRPISPLVMLCMISTSLLYHPLISSFSLRVRMTMNSPVPPTKVLVSTFVLALGRLIHACSRLHSPHTRSFSPSVAPHLPTHPNSPHVHPSLFTGV